MRVYNQGLDETHDEFNNAAEGIRNPMVQTLKPGTFIYRFASSRILRNGKPTTPAQRGRGAWWIAEADFRLVLLRYASSKLPLGTVARTAVAVLPSWSQMDVCIKAEVMFDLMTFTGRGKTQYHDVLPNGMYVTLPGWPDVTQIYIPNIHGDAFDALELRGEAGIQSNKFGF